MIGLSWGITTTSLLKLRGKVDFIIGKHKSSCSVFHCLLCLLTGSDLFFDPSVFEPLIVTVKWLLDNNKVNSNCNLSVCVTDSVSDVI